MAIETLDIYAPILQTGVTGAFLVLVWRLMIKKDRKSYQLIESQNKERRQMYKNMEELVKEVTSALILKNITDEQMSKALTGLTEQLRELRIRLGEDNHGQS